MRRFVAVMGLCFALSMPAAAKKVELTPAQEKVVAIGQNEVESMAMLVDAVESSSPLPVSEEAKAKWEEAQGVHKEAAKLWKKHQYAEAYGKFVDAADLLQPALGEVLAMPEPPQAVVDAGSAQVESLKKMIDGLSEAVASHGTDEAKAAYKDAEALYQEAKTAWATPTTRRDATEKCWASMKKLNEAIRLMWNAPMK